jgi:hypothetical protein
MNSSLTLIPNISCPSCRSARVCNAEYDGIIEETILRIVDIFPFACQVCGMRFYMFSVESMAMDQKTLQDWIVAESTATTSSSSQ